MRQLCLILLAGTAAGVAPVDPCTCKDVWTYQGATYSGCQNTPDHPNTPWCEVVSPACAWGVNMTEPAKTSTVFGRYCGAWEIAYNPNVTCECQDKWTFAAYGEDCFDVNGCPTDACDGAQYHAALTGVKSWCPAKAACATAPANKEGASYFACTPPEKPGACDCMGDWTLNDVKYQGCTTTRHYPQPWCMIDITCKTALLASDKNEMTYAYKYCNDGLNEKVACACKATGCNQLPGDAFPACEVANAPCDKAPEPTLGNEAYMQCQHPACECEPSWVFNGTQYSGCGGTPHVGTWWAHWCVTTADICDRGVVVNDPKLNKAVNTATCTPEQCDCLSGWKYNGTVHDGCTGPAIAATGFKTWCEVDAAKCPSSGPMAGQPDGFRWSTCAPPGVCDCMKSWVYLNQTHEGCATTSDKPGKPWCMVDAACPFATLNFGYSSKQCGDGLNPKKKCTCSTECTVPGGSAASYCETLDYPCDAAPTPFPSSTAAYIACDANNPATPTPPTPVTPVPSTPSPKSDTTPTPGADPCACKDKWSFGSLTYSGCQNTPKSPGAPWCIVEDGPKCAFATNVTEPGTTNLVYTRYCGIFDTIAYDNTTDCKCASKWSVAGDAGCLDQQGCPSEACNGLAKTAAYTGVKSWCEVTGPCKAAPKNEHGPSFAVCVPEEKPGACECMAKWEHNGAQYEGCTTSKDYPGTPWCKIGLTCKNATLHADAKGMTYAMKYCTDGLGKEKCMCKADTCQQMPGDAVPTCEVENAPCLTAPAPTGGNKAIIPCEHPPCECKPTWKWNNTEYEGCTGTPHVGTWYAHWCEVEDTCHTGYNVTEPVTKEVRHIATCTPQECECDATWTYKGKQFKDCEGEAMAETGGKTWCASSTCKTSQKLGSDPTVMWTPCVRPDACECLDNWVHYNVTYSGCATTWDSPGQPWCRVDPNCPDAIVDFWGAHKMCKGDVDPAKPCTCATACVTENVATPYCETTDFPCATAPTPTGNNAAFIKCGTAATPAPQKPVTTPAPGTPTTTPAPGTANACACKDKWAFEGHMYSGCQNTPKSPGAPWCIVEDGPNCAFATNFTEPGTTNLVYTRYCGIFDTIAYDNTTDCKCASKWSVAGDAGCLDQQGCPSEACNGLAKTAAYTGVKSWCEVTGPCKAAPKNEHGPSFAVCVPEEKPGACECMAKWEHNGAQYEGCTTSKDYPGTPWCKIGLTCKNATLHADAKGMTYAMKYCTDGLGKEKCMCKADTCQQMPGDAVPTCEVENAPCLTAPAPTGGNKAIIPCEHPPCECKPTWKWNNTEYEGCTGTPHVGTWYAHWCEVEDTCHTGYNVTEPVTKEVRHIATCTPQECECDATWTYKGKQFKDCEGEAMAETGGKTWCASSTCKTSQKLGSDPTVMWTPCVRPDACECLDNWVHYNVTYSGCATTWDSPGQPWCRVDPNCPDAIVDFWGAHKSCVGNVDPAKPCTCATPCVTENVATPYCETTDFPCATAPTPTGNNAAFIKCDAPISTAAPLTQAPKGAPTATPTAPGTPAPQWVPTAVPFTASPKGTPTAVPTAPGTPAPKDTTPAPKTQDTPSPVAADTPKPQTPGTPAPEHVTTPTPDAKDPCACEALWGYDGQYYGGCQNTPNSPGAPWCVVQDGPNCAYATNVTEPNTKKLMYARFCTVFDKITYDNTTDCTCATDWKVPAIPECLDQHGCPSEACNGLAKTAAYTGVKSWCEVTGPCKAAPKNEHGPSFAVCVPEEKPGACECMAKWEHNGAQYEGCTTSKDYPGTPWCKIGLTCKNATLHADAKGMTYAMKYCTDGLGTANCTCAPNTCQQMPGEAVPTCEASNAPCLTAPAPTGGNKAIIPCQHPPCECKPTWKWNNTEYEGCTGTPHVGTWYAHWCEAKETCITGYNVTEPVTKEVRHIATCTPQECECDATWTYKGKQFKDCEGEAMAETGGKTWCASSTCKTSQKLGSDPTVMWTPCVRPDACECLDNWVHYNVTYSGCATTWDSPGQPWCRVDPNCPDAIVDFWGARKTCKGDVDPAKPCTCATPCVTENVATPYCETTDFPCATAPTPTGLNAAFIKCDAQTTIPVPTQGSAEPATTAPSLTPAPPPSPPSGCACLNEWDYNGSEHFGCQTTSDSPSEPWCKVAPECTGGDIFTRSGYKYRRCVPAVASTVPCACRASSCTDYNNKYACLPVAVPCLNVPDPGPGRRAYALCDPKDGHAINAAPAPPPPPSSSDDYWTHFLIAAIVGGVTLLGCVLFGVLYMKKRSKSVPMGNVWDRDDMHGSAEHELEMDKEDLYQAPNPDTVNTVSGAAVDGEEPLLYNAMVVE